MCGLQNVKHEQDVRESCNLRSARNLSACLPWSASANRRVSGQSLTLAKLDEPGSRTLPVSFFSLSREYSAVTKLYVGNLPFTATDEAVRTLFTTHGTVEKVSLITDRDTGHPRGFAFVEMSNADASRAMQALNGTDFEGRSLRVSEAHDRQRPGGSDRGGPRRR
jgi:RNA recognition motif. (a.k.a. RRM, RBD, or RNP domain)